MRTLSMMVLVAGCGSSETATITFHARDAQFVAFNAEAEPFAALPIEDDGIYELEVEGRYGFARTCAAGAQANTGVIFRTPGDGDEWGMDCTAAADPPTHRLTITSVDNTALVGGCGNVFGTGNELLLLVPEGPCDLMFNDGPGTPTKFWRRNVDVAGDMAIDVDLRGGADLLNPDGTIEPAGDVVMLSYLRTPHGTYSQLSTAELSVRVPPAAALLPGDLVGIEAYGFSGIARAGFTYGPEDEFDESSTVSLTIPEDTPGVSFRILEGRPFLDLAGTWTSEPQWFAATLGSIRMWADYSRSHGEQTERTDLNYPNLPNVEGWDPAWSLPDSASVEYEFSLVHELGDGYFQELRLYR